MPKKKTPKRKAASVKPNTDSDTGDAAVRKDSMGKFPIVGFGGVRRRPGGSKKPSLPRFPKIAA